MRVLEILLSPLSYRVVRLFIFLLGAGAMKGVEAGDARGVVIVLLCLVLWNWRPLLYALPDLADYKNEASDVFARVWNTVRKQVFKAQ